jgi:hypothetical protein
MGTNPEELHTPTSTPKNLEKDNEDMKKKLEFERGLCKNEVWQEAYIVF